MNEKTDKKTYLSNNDQEGVFHEENQLKNREPDAVEKTRRVETPNKEVIERDRYYTSSIAPARRADDLVYEERFATNRLVQFAYYIGGILALLVGLRFVLALFGTRDSGFSAFIFQLTEPLVSPFRGVFSTTNALGTARFEVESLISILVIAVVTFIVAGLIQLLTRE